MLLSNFFVDDFDEVSVARFDLAIVLDHFFVVLDKFAVSVFERCVSGD